MSQSRRQWNWGSNLLAILLSPRFPRFLLGAFLAWFAVWAINPWFPQEFLLEHALTAGFLALVIATHSRFRLSNVSYTLIFLFLSLHVIGAHYTYSKVPYDDWVKTAAGWLGREDFRLSNALGLSRNHFDRLAHFAFGLLLSYPAREVFIRVARARGFWGYYLPIDVVMSFSLIYELLEWGVARVFGGDVGQAYVGTQGDEWDAQKDMALAASGALIAMAVTALINWRLKRDFAREFVESLTGGDPKPLGEVKLAKLLDEKGSGRGRA